MKEFASTTGELFNIFLGVRKTGIMDMKFSRKGGLSVYRNLTKIESELKDYNEQRNNLVNEYKEEGKESVDPENPKWNEFVKAFEELNSVEVKMDINTIVEDDLPEEITPALIAAIDFMIED